MRHALAGALLVAALAGCGETPTEVPRPPDAESFTVPGRFLYLYDDMEECSGIEGDFWRVRWYLVPGDHWESTYWGREVEAEWWPPHDIYLAEGVLNSSREADTVMHEILHDLLQMPGEHPSPPFGDCAPI